MEQNGGILSTHALYDMKLLDSVMKESQRTNPGNLVRFVRYVDKPVTLTPAWKQYAFTVPVPTAYGPGGLAARLQLGQKAGVAEFKNITVTTATP